MKSEFLKYYKNELNILFEGGKEFSYAYPEIAATLDYDAIDDIDPYVERLLEAFVFLSGRIKERLDKDFTKWTQLVMELVAPSFLRPFPSVCMMQFNDPQSRGVTLSRGSLFGTEKSLFNSNSIVFSSTKDTIINPITILSANVSEYLDSLTVKFALNPQCKKIDTDFIELYLHGDYELTWVLHYYLTAFTHHIDVNAQGQRLSLDTDISIPGLKEKESILPVEENMESHAGLLREFFCFKDKFLLIKIGGLNFLKNQRRVREFALTFKFDELFPQDKFHLVKKENFLLNITPAVNLYENQIDPINNTLYDAEYQIHSDRKNTRDIYKVLSVIGVRTGEPDAPKQIYRPLFENPGEDGLYYRHYYKDSNKRLLEDHFVSLVNNVQSNSFGESKISIKAYLSNGYDGREKVLRGDVNKIIRQDRDLDDLDVKNITRPNSYIPRLKSKYNIWFILNRLKRNKDSLVDLNLLKETLLAQCVGTSRWNYNFVLGLVGSECRNEQCFIDSQAYSVLHVALTFKNESINTRSVDEIGQYHLFGCVILEYFKNNVAINNLVSLSIRILPLDRKLTWDAKLKN